MLTDWMQGMRRGIKDDFQVSSLSNWVGGGAISEHEELWGRRSPGVWRCLFLAGFT